MGNIGNTGKPSGYDLKKNMLTLPLIHILDKKSNLEKRLFKLNLKLMLRKNDFNKIKNTIINEGGIEYAESTLLEVSNKARQELEIFEDSDLKEALITVLEFNLLRVI